jgi:hypothetical protein
MKAAMFGMIIPERNVPNFWTAIRTLEPPVAGVAGLPAVVCALTELPPEEEPWSRTPCGGSTDAPLADSVLSHICAPQDLSAKMGAYRSDEHWEAQ